MISLRTLIIGVVVLGAAFFIFVPTWDIGPYKAMQTSYPSGVQFTSVANERDARNQAPPPLPPAATGGPLATAVYKNVKVLTDVSAAEFMRTQQALTDWVSPKEGCGFCHVGQDYASDAKPTKGTAAIMLKMVRHINADWQSHVAPAGVTCYTCHRGQPEPAAIWYKTPPLPQHSMISPPENWVESADTVRKFFPDAGYQEYFLQDEPIRVQSSTALPSHEVSSMIEATRIYEMMMTYSDGIGVNCGYCHNSRAIADWSQSSPYRWNGESGLMLIRDINKNFLLVAGTDDPLTRQLVSTTVLPVLPTQQEGIQIGNGLALCATCHYGLPNPLNGVNMVNSYPALVPAADRPPS